jgi:hypothetical protein
MAEKKVSVRLSAEGGRLVRAELQGIGKAGTQAFGQVTLAQKSAAESAAVFTAALDREDQAFRDLRASLDPAYASTQRYEAAVEQATQAVRAGVATQEEANRVIALARGRLDMFGGAVASGGRGLNAWRGQIQNTAFQLQDFAVQVQAGTAASTALAMQLPQLLGGFGAIGAVIGAGAAIGIPLLTIAMRDNGVEAATLTEQIDALTQAVSALESANEAAAASTSDLSRAYGLDAEQAQRFLAVRTEIARIEAERKLATARDSSVAQFGDFGGLSSEGFRAAAEQLAALEARIAALQARRAEMLASDEGGNFIDIERELADLQNARAILGRVEGDIRRLQETFGITRAAAAGLAAAVIAVGEADGPAQAAAAAEELSVRLAQATDNFRFATDEGRQLGQQLLEVVLQGYRIEALDLASPMSAAVGVAGTLGQTLAAAANAAWDIAAGIYAAAPGAANRALGDDERGSQREVADMSANGLGDFYASQGLAAARRASAVYLAPPRASVGGAPGGGGGASVDQGLSPWFDPEQEQIVLDALDSLTAAQDRYNDSVRDGAETVADLFTSIVDGSKSATEALADLLAQMAQVQIQKAFLGLAESGSTMGMLFSSLGGALSVPVGTNAQGTDFWRGGLTWVGEQGPEIVNLPRGAQVFDAATSRRMAAGGGERQAVSITNHYTIDARGAEAGVEAKIARAIEAQNRMLPDIIKRTLRDPRRR